MAPPHRETQLKETNIVTYVVINMCSMLPLPSDVTSVIDDIACVRRSNSNTSNNILIRVDTSSTASECEDEVIKWVLESISNSKLDSWRSWRIVVGTQHDDYEDDITDKVRNQLAIAVHIDGGGVGMYYHVLDKTELITTNEETFAPQVDSDQVLEALIAEPACITGIGVSAVSDKYMSDIWNEIITEVRDTMDGSGKGPMKHPMWMWFDDVGWSMVREHSYRFGRSHGWIYRDD